MFKKPESVTCDPGDLHKVSIDEYLVRVYDHIMTEQGLERGQGMHPHFELVDRSLAFENGGVVITDGNFRYLTYKEQMVAAVMQTRTEFNYVRVDYYLNLPNGSPRDPNPDSDEL